MKSISGRIVGIVFPIILTVLFLVIGAVLKNDYNDLKGACTYPVTATVVDHKEHTDSDDNSTTYTPIFEYQYNDESYRSNLNTYSSSYRSKYEINSSYDIMIDPNQPTRMFFEPINKSGLVMSTVLTVAGYVLAGVSVVIIIINLVKGVVLVGLIAKSKQ